MNNEYRWTALATLLGLPLSAHSSSRYSSSYYDDFTSVAILWSYARFVDPIFGGVLGCARAFLGMLSTILGNARIGDAIGGLGDARYEKLSDDVAYVDPTRFVRPSRDPILLTNDVGRRWNRGRGGGGIAARMASGMGSASLLVVSTRQFLGLYLLGGTVASLWPYLGKGGYSGRILRGTVGEWSRWWLLGEAGTDGGDVVGDGGSGTFLPWRLSKRLLALYWMITLSKTAVAYILM
jgi:hypothetical protein